MRLAHIINSRIRDLMLEQNRKQREVCALLNLSPPTVNQRLKSESSTFSIEELQALATWLGVSFNDLIREDADHVLQSPRDKIPAGNMGEEIMNLLRQNRADLDDTRKDLHQIRLSIRDLESMGKELNVFKEKLEALTALTNDIKSLLEGKD
jgi:transcriptional regulator with XRE-family HTH domain